MPENDFEKMEEEEYESEEESKGEWSDGRKKSDKQKDFYRFSVLPDLLIFVYPPHPLNLDALIRNIVLNCM